MSWNPFDWNAVPFLTLYVVLATIAFRFGFYLKSKIGPAAEAPTRLSEFELAFLAGGAYRLGDVALLALFSNNGATIKTEWHKITVSDQKPLAKLIDDPPPMDVDPYMTRKEFQSAVEPLVERVRLRLQDLGYCPTNEQTISFRMMALIPIVLLLFVGILKAQAGWERHHPIAILLFFVSITALGIIPLAARPFRTRAGGEVVKSYQEEYARLARAPLDDELIIAVALAGPVVLVGTPYASVYAASETTKGGSDGGGCGGGGGGGGGCGGCGGGD